MISIKVPATSANLGPGFDCLGIALGLYNTFDVEDSDTLKLDGVDERFSGEDNLFVKAYRTAGGTDNIHVTFHCEIPSARGLGSSASLYTGGVLAYMIRNHCIDPQKLFAIVSDLEGHPDNVAPAVFGGLTASIRSEHGWLTHNVPVNETLRFSILVPDYEVHTEEARHLLPDSYPSDVVLSSASRSILMCEGLRCGDMSLLLSASNDQLHEPYRKQAIPSFDVIKQIASNENAALVISGSGPACLLIHDRPLSDSARFRIITLPEHWAMQELPVSSGPEYSEGDLWQGII